MLEKGRKKIISKSMEKLGIKREKALAFLNASWRIKEVDEKFKVDDFNKALDQAFEDKTKDIKKHNVIIRLAGQSGSGKSTQLLPAALKAFEKKGIKPVHIAVREFIKYHPYKEEIKQIFGEISFRENTNNFAVTLAFLVVEKLIENGYPILFEITLLDENFEDYLAGLAAQNGYETSYHVLAVPRKQSDHWIEKRNEGVGVERPRKVSAFSKDYFFNCLPKALKALKESARASCTVWNGYEKEPVFNGKMGDEKVLETLNLYRKKEILPHDPKELVQAKIDWFTRPPAR